MNPTLPDNILELVRSCLVEEVGDSSPVERVTPVPGGDIHRAARIETRSGRYFLKWNLQLPPGMFTAEAEGLRILAAARALRTPAVLGFRESPEGPGCLLLEWIEPFSGGVGSGKAAGEQLGEGLAALHRTPSPGGAFGNERSNYLGRWPQPGGWGGDWATFYRDKRLAPLVADLEKRGRLTGHRKNVLAEVLAACERLLNHRPRPSLLHGDLWSGNWMVDAEGRPVLIDPAPWYGDREVDLAFTELFGGFPDSFYTAYWRIDPPAEGYETRRPLYQLYFALVHLLLFGESYGPLVDRLAGQVLRSAGSR